MKMRSVTEYRPTEFAGQLHFATQMKIALPCFNVTRRDFVFQDVSVGRNQNAVKTNIAIVNLKSVYQASAADLVIARIIMNVSMINACRKLVVVYREQSWKTKRFAFVRIAMTANIGQDMTQDVSTTRILG